MDYAGAVDVMSTDPAMEFPTRFIDTERSHYVSL